MLKRANPCLARPKPTRRIVSASALPFLLAGASAARAADTQVDLQLVLAVDASGSVNQRRFNLQKQGYANAFRNPRVLSAIRSGMARP